MERIEIKNAKVKGLTIWKIIKCLFTNRIDRIEIIVEDGN